MGTWLLTWNPKYYDFDLYRDYKEEADSGIDTNWNCARNRSIAKGDRLFLIRVGMEPRGIVAAGWALGEPEPDEHWEDPDATRNYVPIRWDRIESVPLVAMETLKKQPFARVHWSSQFSGIRIAPDVARALEVEWKNRCGKRKPEPRNSIAADTEYWEGAVTRTGIAKAERNAEARAAALAHHGTACKVCGFDFEKKYGEAGRGLITVHHLNPLGGSKGKRKVVPERDLVPVCPNCHLVIHRVDPPYKPNDVARMLKKR